MTAKKTTQRLDRLLKAMATQPEPSEKPPTESRTSNGASGAGYGDTRTREGKSEATSSKRGRKSP